MLKCPREKIGWSKKILLDFSDSVCYKHIIVQTKGETE